MKISKKQKIYYIVILCILIILPVTYAVIYPFSDRSILYIAQIPCIVIYICGPWLLDKDDRDIISEANRKVEALKTVLQKNNYFTRKIWEQKYSEYQKKHPLEKHQLRAASIMSDLSWQYMKKIIRKSFLVPVLTIPAGFVLWLGYIADYVNPVRSAKEETYGILLTIAAENLLFVMLIYLFSRLVFNRWIQDLPDAHIIKNSYADGYAFTNSYFSLVIGSTYIHGFDGEDFFSVPKKDIKKVKCRIQRINENDKIHFSQRTFMNLTKAVQILTFFSKSSVHHHRSYRKSYRDTYVFSIKLLTDVRSIHVALDQFQIKMVMDHFFPDISDCLNVEYGYKEMFYGILPPSGGSSGPVLSEDKY